MRPPRERAIRKDPRLGPRCSQATTNVLATTAADSPACQPEHSRLEGRRPGVINNPRNPPRCLAEIPASASPRPPCLFFFTSPGDARLHFILAALPPHPFIPSCCTHTTRHTVIRETSRPKNYSDTLDRDSQPRHRRRTTLSRSWLALCLHRDPHGGKPDCSPPRSFFFSSF